MTDGSEIKDKEPVLLTEYQRGVLAALNAVHTVMYKQHPNATKDEQFRAVQDLANSFPEVTSSSLLLQSDYLEGVSFVNNDTAKTEPRVQAQSVNKPIFARLFPRSKSTS